MVRGEISIIDTHLWSFQQLFPRGVDDDKVELHCVDGKLHAAGEILQRTRQERLLGEQLL